MEDAALFISTLMSTYWTAANTDSVTPTILVGYDTNAVHQLRGGAFVNGGDRVYLKEVPNAYTSRPSQIGNNGVRTRTRVNIYAMTAGSTASISPQQHALKLIQECERIVRSHRQQGTTYDFIETLGGSNECNRTNNWAKYILTIECIQMNVTW